MKKNKFSLWKYFKDTYSTACVIPVIAFLLIAIVLCVLGYNKGVLSLQWTIILIVLLVIISILILVWFIFKTLKAIIRSEKETEISQCQNCSVDYAKYVFFRHGLITLNDILEREEKLKDHPAAHMCEVLNYTTLVDTYADGNGEDDHVEPIISNNIKSGVKYKIVYLSEGFASPRNKRIYGEQNLKYHPDQAFRDTQFDYLIHNTPEKMYCYVAVNFISRAEKCGSCNSKATCDFLNDHLLYRVLTDNEARHIYDQINAFFNDGETA